MARNTNLTIPSGQWTQLTADDASKVTFMNIGGAKLYIAGTTSATEPNRDAAKLELDVGDGTIGSNLSDLFPGIAAVRLWATPVSSYSGEISVSHD